MTLGNGRERAGWWARMAAMAAVAAVCAAPSARACAVTEWEVHSPISTEDLAPSTECCPVGAQVTVTSNNTDIDHYKLVGEANWHDDPDTLAYSNWGATGGSIAGSGSAVTWTAPATAGDYTVSVTLSDTKTIPPGDIGTPLIVHWPGRGRPNTRTAEVGPVIDIMPPF